MHANAEENRAKKQESADQNGKGCMKIWSYLWKVYKLQGRAGTGKHLPKQNTRNVAKIERINGENKEEILTTDETFVGGDSSIQVQPGRSCAGK